MDERHLRAVRDIEAGGEGGWAQQGEDGHAVHVVRNGFAMVYAEAAPSFTGGGFQAFQEVEEGYR